MYATNYQIRRLGQMLKAGPSYARIIGKVSLGHRWPDEPHAWIIDDLISQTTYHVPVKSRPTWVRYHPSST
jgi:hypothetical protein